MGQTCLEHVHITGTVAKNDRLDDLAEVAERAAALRDGDGQRATRAPDYGTTYAKRPGRLHISYTGVARRCRPTRFRLLVPVRPTRRPRPVAPLGLVESPDDAARSVLDGRSVGWRRRLHLC